MEIVTKIQKKIEIQKRQKMVKKANVLKINNHCDKGNTYLCLGGCFVGVLRVFHKYFEDASRAFQDSF